MEKVSRVYLVFISCSCPWPMTPMREVIFSLSFSSFVVFACEWRALWRHPVIDTELALGIETKCWWNHFMYANRPRPHLDCVEYEWCRASSGIWRMGEWGFRWYRHSMSRFSSRFETNQMWLRFLPAIGYHYNWECLRRVILDQIQWCIRKTQAPAKSTAPAQTGIEKATLPPSSHRQCKVVWQTNMQFQ